MNFATEEKRKLYDCGTCKPQTAIGRKCSEQGFNNIAPRALDETSLKYTFCVGKATWYEEITELYEHCLVAYETGIMPSDGSLNDQDPLFYEVFPFFVQRYQEKKYVKVWRDVSDYVSTVLQSIFGKKGR